MKNCLSKSIRNEKGQALVAVLGLLVIGGLTIAPLLAYMSTGLGAGQVYEEDMVEFYAADAGVELALWNLMNGEVEVPQGGQTTLPQFPMNAKTVNVTVDDIGAPTYRITSIAASDYSSSTTIEVYVTATMGFFDSDFTIFEGNFQLGPGEEFEGNVWSEGNAQLDISGRVTGNVYAGGNVQLDIGAIIEGDVYAEGNVQLDAEAQIIGNICAGGDVQLDTNAQIAGNVYAGGNVQLYAGAIIDGDVYTNGNVQLDTGAEITGNVYPFPAEGCPLSEGSSSQILSWQINP